MPAIVQLTDQHNFFHLLFPFVSDGLPYAQTTSSFILGYDGFNLAILNSHYAHATGKT